jgi:glycosyltransferase involved in cell wall biosynthesis
MVLADVRGGRGWLEGKQMSAPDRAIAHVLIIVQNLPVPLDRRVWLEAQALRNAGYAVSVICPKGPGDPDRHVIDGVEIYKYRPAPQAEALLGYAWEFAYSWARTAALSVKVWRRRRFQVLQACNPPDTYWLLAQLWRSRGVRFVFDQHDLNPELFISRFGEPRSLAARLQYRALRWLERQTYAAADRVISTNESYRHVAIERGGLPPECVDVVRSGPDTRRMRPVVPYGHGWRGGAYLLVYLGVMGPQDNVEILIDVMDALRRRGRHDVFLAMLGFGDRLEWLKAETARRGLDSVIEFAGRVGPPEIAEYLSSADVGLSPDRKTPLNDVSTMNKTMEYMAYGLPSVTFDLKETRVSAADSALYVPDGDVEQFSDAVEALLDDWELRVRMGLRARERVSRHLDWRPQAAAYVASFDALVGHTRKESTELVPSSMVPSSFEYVTDDVDALEIFLRERNRPERRALAS